MILYGDIELTVLHYLRQQLLAYPLAAGVELAPIPPDKPDVFVLVRKVGGSRRPRTMLADASLDVQVWHRTENQACDLADIVSGLLEQLPNYGTVRSWRESAGPIYVPDPDTGGARYLMTVDLVLKGVPA